MKSVHIFITIALALCFANAALGAVASITTPGNVGSSTDKSWFNATRVPGKTNYTSTDFYLSSAYSTEYTITTDVASVPVTIAVTNCTITANGTTVTIVWNCRASTTSGALTSDTAGVSCATNPSSSTVKKLYVKLFPASMSVSAETTGGRFNNASCGTVTAN